MRFLEIVRFELAFRINRPETYAFFIIALLIGLLSVDFIFEDGLGSVRMNSPYAIAMAMSISQIILLLLSSMVMGMAVLRDYQYVMESLIFVTPITKLEYLLGRFVGSFIILFFVSIGLVLGIMLNSYAPWRGPEELLGFSLIFYLSPFIEVVIPTLIYSSFIFFVSGMLSKKLIVVYTQGIFFFMFYLATVVFSQLMEDTQVASFFDPFAFQTIKSVVQYWTPYERNTYLIPLGGLVLYNRLLWLIIGLIVGYVGYIKFSFDLSENKSRDSKIEGEDIDSLIPLFSNLPEVTISNDTTTEVFKFFQSIKYHFRTILLEPIFWVIIACLIVTIFINSINLGTAYGVDSLPKTYLIIEELQELSVFFFIIVLVIYTGELMWEGRDARIDSVMDVLPVGDVSIIMSKFFVITLIFGLLMLVLSFTGVVFQVTSGYNAIDISVYASGLILGLMPDLMLFSVISLLLQAITNHKFLSHLLLIVFVVFLFILNALGYNHPLISFGGLSLGKYSEMNGYGDSITPYLWTKFYWFAIATMCLLLAGILVARGKEVRLLIRFKKIWRFLNNPMKRLGLSAFMATIMSGCYIFYNVNVLQDYTLPKTEEAYRIYYEQTFKQYENTPQPKVVAIKYDIDLFPKKQEYIAHGKYQLENKSDAPIAEIYVQKMPNDHIILDTLMFSKSGQIDKSAEEFGFYKYRLERPLSTGDSVSMAFRQLYISDGFGTEANIDLVQNGTFLNDEQFPTLGYNSKFEIRDPIIRSINDLPERRNRPRIDNQVELKNGRTGGDGYEVNFEVVVSTDSSQIAIAPGVLDSQWIVDDRSYYNYKMKRPMVNFYNIVSAKYDVKKDNWSSMTDNLQEDVQLEIYYHPAHVNNLDRMMRGMKASLDYYTETFGPYPYQELRIMEFPRYRMFAQSFPGTIPYSESLGFILDIDDEVDVDMVFYVTAHEVAHQWWGLQVVPANVEGRHMIAETLAQYSATMLLEKEYGTEKAKRHLARERERYLTGRTNDDKAETSLARVTSHKYVHYGKGAINMYALQNYIGEEKVNLALRRFVGDWNAFDDTVQQDRYATTDDLIDYFREVTPDSLLYIISDLFEKITLYDNQVLEASYKETSSDEYELTMEVQSTKYSIDSLGGEHRILVNDWIDIGVYSLNSEGEEELIYLKKHHLNNQSTNLKVITNKLPSSVAIDPHSILIDRNLEDNQSTVEISLIK